MSKTVTATEAKNTFGSLISEAQEGPVIVESRGVPKVAIVSIKDLHELETLREAEWRRQALDDLRRLREKQEARNADLSFEEATAIVERARGDIFESLMANAKARVEE